MNVDPGKIGIRPVSEFDLDEIITIADLLPEAPHWSRERYDDALRANATIPRIGLVAVDRQSREVVGFTMADLVVPEAELETIAVALAHQRQGIGSRLFAALVNELKAAAVLQLHLEVRASNLAAIRFYESKDFRKTGVRPRYYADPEEDAVLMSLRLG